jgi:tRNA G18 (ribose-2'-O)-methylase SpoU
MYSCQNPFAVGAIIRVAHNFLAREIIIVGAETYYEKASMGMEKYETIIRVPDADALFGYAGRRPVWAVEKDHARQSIYGVRDFPEDVVLLFGSERAGIPRAVIDRTSHVIGIPIYGVNHSLPVTVAAGIVMSEWARRRYPNGVVI